MTTNQRTIKFRAWDWKEMRYNWDKSTSYERVKGGEAYLNSFIVPVSEANSGWHTFVECMYDDWEGEVSWSIEMSWDTYRKPVMQFIWLKDLDSNEIYEGDIVIPNAIDEKCVVYYDEDRARFSLIRPGGTFRDCQNIRQVVGNIYEHRNLLDTE